MDGQTTCDEERGFLPSDQVPEAAGDAVIEEEENLGGDELTGEENEDPVESDGQAIEDRGHAVEDGEVKEEGGNGEVGEDVNKALEEDESNVEAIEDEKSDGQAADDGESNVETGEDEESDVRAAALRRGGHRRPGISAETIEEPAETIQEKVCLRQE